MDNFIGPLRMRKRQPLSPFTCDVPEHIQDRLALLQVERLHAFLPLLCLMIAASAVAMAVAVMGDLPLWQQLTPPFILVGACLGLLLRSRLRGCPASAKAAYHQLHTAMLVTAGLGLVAGLWSVNAFTETEKYYCMVAPVFIGIGALVTATCLLSVPRAAIAGMMTTVMPVVFKMLLFDNLGVRVMAVMMVIITIMQSSVVLSKFRETVAMLTLQDQLNRAAETDFLTGLDNRKAFMAKLDAACREGQGLLALADLDQFKPINDTHGHMAGDAVLVEVATRMKQVAVSATSVARLGGDEFALVYPASVSASQVDAELQALRQFVSLPIAFGPHMLSVDVSLGTAEGLKGVYDSAALLARADKALYANKGAGPLVRRATVAA